MLVALALVAGGIVVWRVVFPSDDAMIRRQLHALAETASFASDEPPLSKLTSAARLVSFFTVDGEVDLRPWDHPPMTIRGRDELRQTALAARSAVSTLAVRVENVDVTFVPASAEATVRLTVVGRTSRDTDEHAQEMQLGMAKVDGTWLIRRATTVDYLEP